VRLGQSNERLQLTRESRDLAATAANLKLKEIWFYILKINLQDILNNSIKNCC
jgi:hypothetical protein